MATDFHPLITVTVRVASRILCCMLLLRNLVGGAKQNHTMVLTVGDLGSFQHQPQQDSRGPLWGPTGPLVLVSARLQKIQTKQKHKRQAKTEGKEDKNHAKEETIASAQMGYHR